MELQILKQMAAIKGAEAGIVKGDKTFDLFVEAWCNGYLEAEKDQRLKNEYTNMIEDKIKKMLG